MNANMGTAVITLTVNGERHAVAPGTTLEQLLDALRIAPANCTTAVNGQFVARAARVAHALRQGDAVTCFQAIVGG